jgi:hypothetical protein
VTLRQAFVQYFTLAKAVDPGQDVSPELLSDYGRKMSEFCGTDADDIAATVDSLIELSNPERPKDMIIVSLMIGHLAGTRSGMPTEQEEYE